RLFTGRRNYVFLFCLFAHSVLGHWASWKLALGNIKIAKNKGPQIAVLFTFVSNFQRLVFLKSHSHDHQNEVHRFLLLDKSRLNRQYPAYLVPDLHNENDTHVLLLSRSEHIPLLTYYSVHVA